MSTLVAKVRPVKALLTGLLAGARSFANLLPSGLLIKTRRAGCRIIINRVTVFAAWLLAIATILALNLFGRRTGLRMCVHTIKLPAFRPIRTWDSHKTIF